MEKQWGENIVDRVKSMSISRGWKLLGISRVLSLRAMVYEAKKVVGGGSDGGGP